MGLDRPGITPTKRKKAKVVKRKPPPSGGVAGAVTTAAKTTRVRQPAPPRKRVIARGTGKAGVGVSGTARVPVRLARSGGAKTTVDRNGVVRVNLKDEKAKRARRNASLTAPVLTVLEQTTRPLHAVAGAADAVVTGRDPVRAAVRGIQNKDKTTFSKVLKHAGAPKAVQTALGLPLDIAADPTTYLTFGAGPVARKAVAAGAAKSAPKGLTVKFAGKEVPAVRKATGETVGRAASRTARSRPAKAAKRVIRDVNPNIAPEGVGKVKWQEATSAARTARATTGRKAQEARDRAAALRKALGKDDNLVVDAIERAKIGSLPTHLRPAAIELRSQYRHIARLQRQAGIPGATRANYVPHYTKQSLAERAPSEVRGSVGKRVIRPASSKARTRQGTLAEKRVDYPGEYNEDAALAFANRMTEGHRAVTQAQLNARLAQIGRPVKPGEDLALAEGEALFRHRGSDLVKVTDKREQRRAADRGGAEYVVLHEAVVKHAHATNRPGGGDSTVGRAFDRTQGAFKAVATATPGFHVRNLVGDTQNAYLGQSGHRLPGNIVRSGKSLRALKRAEESSRTLGQAAKPIRGSVKIDGRQMSYEDLAQEAARVGAIRSGYQNRELHDLLKPDGAVKKVKGDTRRGRAGRAVKRTLQSREDLPRLATYIEARRKGMPPEQAAAHAMKYHFDYANLTEHERRFWRRAMPFYTFSSRNIPLQLKTVVQKPGKYANYQKIREEATIAAGLDPGFESGLTPWEQRNAPVPVKIGGKQFTVSAGLPITDLNEFPTTANVLKLAEEYMNKGGSLITPLLKDPVEIWANYSFFFRDQIKRENSPLVPAPSFVSGFSPSMKKRLGVAQIIDKRTGKKIWAWDAFANYAAHVVPGLPSAALGFASPSDRAGRGTPEKAASLGGVKVTPRDATTVQINNAYDELDKLKTKLGALSQQGIKAGNPRRDKLNAQSRALERKIYQLAKKRGDRVLPTQGKPRKVRRRVDDDMFSRDDDDMFGDGTGSDDDMFGP